VFGSDVIWTAEFATPKWLYDLTPYMAPGSSFTRRLPGVRASSSSARLTCDWLELAFAAGGTVVSEDGSKATINSHENVAATQLLVE